MERKHILQRTRLPADCCRYTVETWATPDGENWYLFNQSQHFRTRREAVAYKLRKERETWTDAHKRGSA